MGTVLKIEGVFPDADTEKAYVDAIEAVVKEYAADLTDATLSTDFNGAPELPVGEPVAALTISGLLNAATVGAPFSSTLTATGGVAPYVWLADGLVDGLNIDSATGAITGTPNVGGAAVIHVAVHDSDEPPNVADEHFHIIVAGPISDEDRDQDAKIEALTARVAELEAEAAAANPAPEPEPEQLTTGIDPPFGGEPGITDPTAPSDQE